MDWGQRLNAALDALERTTDREPDLEAVAALANCSLYHFLRMFDVVAGVGPAEYARRRRLSRAALDLAATDDRVLDVALRYGYETPEAFAKAFKRLFGLTPTEAREPGRTLETWPPLRVAVVLKGERAMQYRIVEKPALTLVGWPLRVSTVGGENFRAIPEFWDRCLADGKVGQLERVATPLGMVGLCAEQSPATEEFTYFIAVEQAPGRAYPEGTRALTLAPATYAVFTAIGAMPDAIQDVWKQAFTEWFPASDYEHAGCEDFEVYPPFPEGDPRGDPASAQNVSEVWIPLKKKA